MRWLFGAIALTTAACSAASLAGEQDVRRIVPVNGDLAEVVWALGLGSQVVATDISATFPPEADHSPKVGYQRALVAETVLAFEPTIVLADDNAGPPAALEQLEGTGVTVTRIPRSHTLDEPVAKVRAVAEALGVDGAALAERVQASIDDAVAGATAPVTTAPVTTIAVTTTAATTVAAETTAAPIDAATDDSAAVSDIYRTVFDSTVPAADKVALIEDGEALLPTIEAYRTAGDPLGGIKLEPSAVTIDGDLATLTYDVLFAGTPVYEDLEGAMVDVGGWIVSREEFCGFMAQARNPCP